MKIVYWGDSITNAGKNLKGGSTASLGQGYVFLTAARLSTQRPGSYTFLNRGMPGNRIVDLYARIKSDVWNQEPELLSILVGFNDAWFELIGQPTGVETGRFAEIYRTLLSETRERLPETQLLLMEPFTLCGPATEPYWERLNREVRQRAEIVRSLAMEFRAGFVELQNQFDDACRQMPVTYWLADGVHPTPAGHQLIAEAWMRVFETEQKEHVR